MTFIDYNTEDLYKEVRDKAEAEGVFEHEGWKSLVEDVIAEHAEFAELGEDELMEIREKLVAHFGDFEEEHKSN